MKRIMMLAVVVYFLIAPFTYHPDTKLVLYYPSLNNGKVWDIYSYLNSHVDDAPKFHYPPMHYWLLKAELPIVRLIGGKDIINWLKIGGNIAFKDKHVFLFNLATKFPLLILVLMSGFLIGKILIKNGYKEKTAKLAMIIWFFNPITLYSAVIMGQNDILAIFPFLVGLWFYFDHPWIAFTLFGFSGSIKSFPLIWAIILALNYPKFSWQKKIGLALWPLIFYVVTMLPFLKFSYFRQDVLYSGLSIRIFDGAWDISMGDKILIVPLLLVALTLMAIKLKTGKNIQGLSLMLVATNLVILGFTHFNPQWFIWLMPFISIVIATTGEWWWYGFLLPPLLGIILLFGDKYLYWGLITPINPNIINLPLIEGVLQRGGIDVVLLNNLCHSVIAGIAIFIFFYLFNQKKHAIK
jgi:hypothetical protein